MTPLLPAPKIAGLLMARCPMAGEEPDPFPYKAITITTAYGSVKLDGYADIEREFVMLTSAGETLSPFVTSGHWLGVSDGDPRAFALYQRHYSFRTYKTGRTNRLIAGPGEKMVLLTYQADALFVWRKFDDMRHEPGVNCAVFRNESAIQSSTLILEAMELAWQRWPGERLYTYVNGKKVKSTNPGYCYKRAGWKTCGTTKSGLAILEALPAGYVAREPEPTAEPRGVIVGRLEDLKPRQMVLPLAG